MRTVCLDLDLELLGNLAPISIYQKPKNIRINSKFI